MQKTNQILVEKLNSKNENAYEVVKTNDDIVEMKRKQYTQIEDGTTKVSVISDRDVDNKLSKKFKPSSSHILEIYFGKK